MNIQRIKDNKSRYKQDDYRMLNEFYKLKIQQVHIVGEYAWLSTLLSPVKNSSSVMKLPNDLPIFCPLMVIILLCIQ